MSVKATNIKTKSLGLSWLEKEQGEVRLFKSCGVASLPFPFSENSVLQTPPRQPQGFPWLLPSKSSSSIIKSTGSGGLSPEVLGLFLPTMFLD